MTDEENMAVLRQRCESAAATAEQLARVLRDRGGQGMATWFMSVSRIYDRLSGMVNEL